MPTTDETAEQVAKARLALEAAEAEHAAALTTADDNKTAAEHALELLEEVVMCLGNRPTMRLILSRLKKASAPPTPAPAIASEDKAA